MSSRGAIKTFKYRIKDRLAKRVLAQHAIASNQVWNWCVAQHRDMEARHKAGAPARKWPSAFDLAKACNGVGAELHLHQQTVATVCDQFAKSRNQARRCPRFRSSFGLKRALGWVPFQRQSRRADGKSITYLGKRYRFFGSKRRPLPENAKGGFFVEDSLGRWWVCFHVEVERPTALTGEVGIDLGLKSFAALSTGETIEAPRIYRRLSAQLAIAHRAKNYRRAAAVQAKMANARRDFHHKLSTRLARSYALIAVGNVNAQALARTKMAKSVMDAGWSSFRWMLHYKAARFAEVGEHYTSQTCSACGIIPASSPKGMGALGIRSWDCSECGASHDRDVNAALNILRIGRSVAPRADESRRAA